jgi:hypothetical protein
MTPTQQQTAGPSKSRWWWRAVRRAAPAVAAAFLVGAVIVGVAVKDHVRSLWSLRRVPNTNLYVMDYYGAYDLREVRERGMDVTNPEAGLIRVFLPAWLVPVADHINGPGATDWTEARPAGPAHCCSTVAARAGDGRVYVGRNFDWKHDPCLVVRIHGRAGASSVAVLDPAALRLDAEKLANPSLSDRLRLLFAPYVVEDGLNEHGVAVSEMSVDSSRPPRDAGKPDVLNVVALRLVLDYARSTDEAVELLRGYNIHFPVVPCHFLIADRGGKSVVVEFIDGKMEVVPSSGPWQVATNHLLCGKSEAENCRASGRYRKASERLAQAGPDFDAGEVMDVLAALSVENGTMWTSVYDLSTGEYRVAYRRQYGDLFRGCLPMR